MRNDLESPSTNAATVRYRFGWGLLVGALGISAFVGLFVYYLLTPEQAAREFNPFVPWVCILVFGPIALLMLAGALFTLSRTHRVRVDERGMWFSSRGNSDLVAWSELRGVHAREPRPKKKDDPESRVVTAALELYPNDDGFADRHGQLAQAADESACTVDLPGRASVRKLAQAITSYRPDLLR